MKKILCFLVFILVLSTVPAIAAMSAVSGKIIDILDSGIITIQLSKGHPLTEGDTVSLTYMAGSLPMAIGDYKITAATNVICLAEPLATSMPPSNGMTVKIDLLGKSAQSGGFDKKPFRGGSPKTVSPPAQSIEIVGSVVAVNGDEITVETTGSHSPRVGWFVDLFYVTSQGKELPVGTWKVETVTGRKLRAKKIKGIGNANKNLKAVVYNRKKKVSQPQPQPPAGGGSTHPAPEPFVASQARAVPSPVSRTAPIQLLGETAPMAPPKTMAVKPQRRQPALPPGVKQKPNMPENDQPIDPEVARLVSRLKSNNFYEKRTAAKIIYRQVYSDPALFDQLEKELLNSYLTARDKIDVDALSWMCKAISISQNHKYYDTVYTVSKKAKSRKLRKYAKKALLQLK